MHRKILAITRILGAALVAALIGACNFFVDSWDPLKETKVDAPIFSVSGSDVTRSIAISSDSSDVTIYYTLDRTTPTTSSSAYSSPIIVSGYAVSKTIRAIAACAGIRSAARDLTITVTPNDALSLEGSVTTLAGSTTSGSGDGIGGAAGFSWPYDVATDGTNLYVPDKSNNEIRQIVIATGVVTTLAGSTTKGSADGTGNAASFNAPNGITTDGTNLYVSDGGNSEIRQIVIATGVVTTLAGSTTVGSADGTGSAASFNGPIGITTEGANLYVADYWNHEIRKIVIATGVVTTLAGSTTKGSADGTGSTASFYCPGRLTTDGINLYVSDFGNNKIRKIVIATGVVTTLAGSTTKGSADGTGNAASFDGPTGITTDGTNLYVSDYWNNEIRQIVIATGVVTTLAGSTTNGSADGTGNAASFDGPTGITTDGTNLYVSDTKNNEIRVIK